MKKACLIILIIGLIAISLFLYNKNNTLTNQEETENEVDSEIFNSNTDEEENEEIYIDDNPIIVGLYEYTSAYRKLVTEYISSWSYHNDINTFNVFYTNEEYISSARIPTVFDEYLNNYTDIDDYRIGYIISFSTTNEEFNQTILSPKDTLEFYDYLEIYLYDGYHRAVGEWYSHTTEDEMTDETILTSIKLTAGVNYEEITSDITLTAFTYDEDDFDDEGNYIGISKYTITVKNA